MQKNTESSTLKKTSNVADKNQQNLRYFVELISFYWLNLPQKILGDETHEIYHQTNYRLHYKKWWAYKMLISSLPSKNLFRCSNFKGCVNFLQYRSNSF